MARELERDELHRTIWQIANDLRGSVDGWDFKTYVLGMLFYRFISENLTSYINKEEQRTGHKNFNYCIFRRNRPPYSGDTDPPNVNNFPTCLTLG